MDKIRVLLADDHPLIRSGIQMAIARKNSLTVVGEASDGDQAQQFCRELNPDVILLDLSMPGPSPRETILYIQKHCPEVKIIVLTAYDNDAYVQEMIRLSVAGYILKDEAAEILADAIGTVMDGGRWLSQAILEKIVHLSVEHPDAYNQLDLTERECDVLTLVARGLSNIQIADELCLAEQTVKNYVSRIYEKLDVVSRPEAIVWAREHGFCNEE